MTKTTFIWVVLCLLVSLAISYGFYFIREKRTSKITWFLFGLRSTSIFLLLLLWLDPTIDSFSYIDTKPELSVVVDNSSSVSFLNGKEDIASILKKVQNTKALQDKFLVRYYQFGNDLRVLDSLQYNEPQTNMYKALERAAALQKDKLGAILLVSDGNQTFGNTYEYLSLGTPVYPIVVGDTTSFDDLSIARVNVNRYSYLNNKFPVEVFVNYEGSSPVNTQLTISSKGKIIYKKNVAFTADKKSSILNTSFTSTEVGTHYYTVQLTPLNQEKNTANNTLTFAVEVLDNETNVLLLSSFIHPDLGALKKSIESSEQRKVAIKTISEFKGTLDEYQLVLLYQPTAEFASIFNELKSSELNYGLITGTQTDWTFLNSLNLGFQKGFIRDTEVATARYHKNFLPFIQNDIGFSAFPPLSDVFGELKMQKNHQSLLFQTLSSIETNQPLLATLEDNNQRAGVLFGEGIWKWRAASYVSKTSYSDFDEFISNFIQYLASKTKKERLTIEAASLYPGNTPITIRAMYVDQNFNPDTRAQLTMTLEHTETGEKISLPFSVQGSYYGLTAYDLKPGTYKYLVAVANQSIQSTGVFKVSSFKVEEQFSKANLSKLTLLASQNNGKVYHSTTVSDLVQNLIEDTSYTTLQKKVPSQEHIINWIWVLVALVGLLSVEWFVRKYYGKI